MLWNSRLLNGINWAFFLSVVGLNITGLLVTNQLGSVFRAVLLTSRTASVSFERQQVESPLKRSLFKHRDCALFVLLN